MVELLPDYAIGALGDAEMATVEGHLVGCPSCQAELDDVLVVGAMLQPATPRPAVKVALLARSVEIPASQSAGTTSSSVPSPTTSAEQVVAPGAPVPSAYPLPFPASARDRRWSSVGRLGLVAAVLVLIVGLAGWNLRLQRDLDRVRDEETIAGIVGDGAVVFALGDPQSPTGTTGLLYADPDTDTALLVANDLPPLEAGEEFQVWLFTADDQRIAASRFTAGTGNDAVVPLQAPGAFAQYVSIGVTNEPPGVTEPSGTLTLAGQIGDPVPPTGPA